MPPTYTKFKSQSGAGFTIVELIVAVVVMGLLVGLVLGSLGGYYQGNINTLTSTTQETDSRSVLRSIERELADSSGFLPTTSVAFSSPQGMNNGSTAWSYKGLSDAATTNRRVLIAQAYATDLDVDSEARLPVFTNTGSGCGPSVAVPTQVNKIYFIARDPNTTLNQYNLYRRTLVPTTGLCATPIQKRSCAAANAVASPAVCQATDAMLVNNVDTFVVDYYTSPNDANPIADQYSNTIDKSTLIRGAKSIKMTVSSKRTVEGRQSIVDASIRISRPY